MDRRTNQPCHTKWADVQINYRIQNGLTYKSNQLCDMKWGDLQSIRGILNEQT